MLELTYSPEDLQQIYRHRFQGKAEYRTALWRVLCKYFARWIPQDATVLDLGCGYCEFMNNVSAGRKLAMDLNPDARQFAQPTVQVLLQDCSLGWNLTHDGLDVVFSSNFFEHLPSKAALENTLREAYSALKPGARLIAIGPNAKYLAGAYWDFFDHYIPLTHLSLVEVLRKVGFEMDFVQDRFLPYTMSRGQEPPIWTVTLYLKLPLAWRFLGRQFLVVARKPV